MLIRKIDNSLRVILRNSPAAPVLRKYFRRSPIEEALEIGRSQGWSTAASWILYGQGRHFLQSKQFHNIFRQEINTSIEYEYLLTAMRKLLLINGLDNFQDSNHIDAIKTIIIQSHHNEFVWYVSDEEKDRINAIANNLKPEGKNKSATCLNAILLSMYGRVGQISNLTYEGHCLALQAIEEMPSGLSNLLFGFIAEHDELQEIKAKIKQFGKIENKTSKAIAQNYEEYPYPRWIDWEFPTNGSRPDKLHEFFTDDELSFTTRTFNVLVAGCGTGSKAIEYAIGYGDNVKITAVDLSRTSLSYAKYMAKKLKVNNIEFMQMDLLDLPKLDMTFEIVECTGVLHHMKDPLEGARAIIDRVKSAGLVHISLYSELARKSIVELRERYGLSSDMTNNGIRYMRTKMMQNDADLINESLSLRWDFFDLNRCKDLLFHPLEHRYTVPEIEVMLSELGLAFRGIERPDIIRSDIWTRYPSEKDIRNLQKWHEFELRHPRAFGNLYEIWALK